jgi:hypothetical protein
LAKLLAIAAMAFVIDAAVFSGFDCANARYPHQQGKVSLSALNKVQAAQARKRVGLPCYVAYGPHIVTTGKAA